MSLSVFQSEINSHLRYDGIDVSREQEHRLNRLILDIYVILNHLERRRSLDHLDVHIDGGQRHWHLRLLRYQVATLTRVLRAEGLKAFREILVVILHINSY